MKRLMLITVILFAVIAVIQPAAAQSTTWTAEYFGNPSLIGPPTVG
jgi:hypothetical protein